ncbi:MAG: hypothetical protein LUF30_03530 [Lachnospiraceae bacterium]|nr:hypothetical protein [Lachnospiraceae bacterium]
MLSLDVELEYDNFTGKAYRRIEMEGSLAVMFGSLCWMGDVWDVQYMQTAADVFDAWDEGIYPVSQEEELDIFLYQCEDAWLQAALVEAGIIAVEETEVETERYDASAEEAGMIAVEEAEVETEIYDAAVMNGNVAVAGDFLETEIGAEAIGQ